MLKTNLTYLFQIFHFYSKFNKMYPNGSVSDLLFCLLALLSQLYFLLKKYWKSIVSVCSCSFIISVVMTDRRVLPVCRWLQPDDYNENVNIQTH